MSTPAAGVCPKCGRGVETGWRVCPDCATPLELATHAGAQASAPPAGGTEDLRFPVGTILAGGYRILGLLGRGGMGEVYRARDSSLGRDVAIKILPAMWLADRDRLSRFDREARLLAALNHPHIGAIYGVQQFDGARALVLELVEGPTLADRLAAGPLPAKEALAIAAQIADALDAAHQGGIVHRDLKPANIKIRPDGQVKVLDFGLAKAVADDAASQFTQTATEAVGATREGTLFGTVPYMSPEQTRGTPVDKRTDIWAFGCVVYEMLTGQPAFDRATWSDTIAAILERDPDWSALPPSTPPGVRRLLSRCLEKDPARRLRDIADARFELDDPGAIDLADARATGSFATMGSRRGGMLGAALTGAISAVVVGSAVWFLKPAAPSSRPPVARLSIALPPGDTLGDLTWPTLALSPDGRTLVYTANRSDLSPRLFVRAIDSLETRSLPGTEGASSPFFSPDGQWIGFFAEGKLKKTLAAGGGLQTVCDGAGGFGGTWAGDGSIYFVPFNTSGIWKVPAAGGTPQEITRLNRSQGEVSHRWPQMLADGKTLLFTVWTGPGWDEKHLEVQIGGGEHRVLVRGASTGRYVPSGQLLYSRADDLVVAPFDLESLRVTGSPVTLIDRAMEGEGEGAQSAVSASGTLAYVPADVKLSDRELVWVRPDGRADPIPAPPQAYTDPSISPDGRYLAVSIQGPTQTIWIYDFARSTLTTLPSVGSSQAPIWTPDGHRLVYRGTRMGYRNVFWRPADGGGEEERLTTGERVQTPASISRDGLMLFQEVAPDTRSDIWVAPLGGTRQAKVFLQTRFSEAAPQLSPDGHVVAYVSGESGRGEIYVRSFANSGGKFQVSTGGGTDPRWSRDGRKLFYRNGDKMMEVSIAASPALTAGSPRLLFEGSYQVSDVGVAGYDVAADGRFLMIRATTPRQPATRINIVLNWLEDVNERVRAAAR